MIANWGLFECRHRGELRVLGGYNSNIMNASEVAQMVEQELDKKISRGPEFKSRLGRVFL